MSAKQRRLIAAFLREQKKAARKEFGPVPDSEQLTLEVVRNSDLPAHFAFAYERTGLLITAENEGKASTEDLKRWHADARIFRSRAGSESGRGQPFVALASGGL